MRNKIKTHIDMKSSEGKMYITSEPVKSLAQYSQEVTSFLENEPRLYNDTQPPMFRGQADESWKLVPGLYRTGKWQRPGEASYWEREMLRDFKLLSRKLVKEQFVEPANDLEWLFVMQHYGMPTRLLDWTESFLVALYFAVCDYEQHPDQNGAVWILDGRMLNSHAMKQDSIPHSSDKRMVTNYALNEKPGQVTKSVTGEYPVALRANKGTPRIIAQKGIFTVHGKRTTPLEDYIQIQNAAGQQQNYELENKAPILLRKILIDARSKKQISKQLYVAGISNGVLFPEITGISHEIAYRYSNEFIGGNANR